VNAKFQSQDLNVAKMEFQLIVLNVKKRYKMIIKTTIIAIVIIAFLVVIWFKPRIDKANGKYILWYGIKNRKFIFL